MCMDAYWILIKKIYGRKERTEGTGEQVNKEQGMSNNERFTSTFIVHLFLVRCFNQLLL